MKGRNLCQEEHRWRNKDKDERENSTVPCQVILRELHTCEDRVHVHAASCNAREE